MAKKNSSKTATEKAISASEPKVQVFSGWQGVNFKDAPLGWSPIETGWGRHRQTDLRPNYLLVQNNVETTDGLTLQTRMDSEVLGTVPSDYPNARFTGVACLFHRWLICVVHEPLGEDVFHEFVVWRDITDPNVDSWNVVTIFDAERNGRPTNYVFTEIGYYEGKLIAMAKHEGDSSTSYEGEIFTADLVYEKTLVTTVDGIEVQSDDLRILDETDPTRSRLRSVRKVSDPTTGATITPRGDLLGNSTGADITDSGGTVHHMITRMDVCYVYVNKYGSTLPSPVKTLWCEHDPVTWSSNRYVSISGTLPSSLPANHGITGVDVYCSLDNKQTKAFIGHVEFDGVPSAGQTWSYAWIGAMSDVSQWTNVQLKIPEENTTKGVPATHFSNHDSRLYFWGDPDHPYRLYIGGNPGAELSIARGLGGAFVDIEPGTGIEIMGTAKWKTVSGASIVTMMCGNPNTNMVKRFNLVETNTTITNEVSSKGYMYEEVSNVIGCNSRWGYGVFADGLYSISRYGLMLTTMAMEYNSQMRNQQVSDVIQPIFTERLGERVNDARMVCIDDVIYIVLSEDSSTGEPTNLDQVVLCYDLNLKAWYTFTHDYSPTQSGELILHAMAIDSQEHAEGLGLITDREIRLYPTTGTQDGTQPAFNVLVETGELAAKQPVQATHYLSQLEFRFDYFVGNLEILVEGTDYYGRPFKVRKTCNREEADGVLRSRVEWIRIDKLVESYRIRIKGKARMRLTHVIAKVYTQSNKVGIPYGFDSHDSRIDRQGAVHEIHHYIEDYNNLRDAIVT